jgi:hypothetical protein
MFKVDVLFPDLCLNVVFIDNLVDLSLEVGNLQPTFGLYLVSLSLSPSLSDSLALVLDCFAAGL